MSTQIDSRTPATAGHAVASAPHVSFPHLVRSEWIKFWTVRSTWWILPITVLMMAGLGWLVTWGIRQVPPGGGRGSGGLEIFDATTLANVMVSCARATIT